MKARTEMLRLITFLSLLNKASSTETPSLRRKLAECFNTAPHGSLDQGCNEARPICIVSSTGNEPSANVAGDKCGKCINTVESNVFTDLGCSPEAPLCNAPLGLGGDTCLPALPQCTNTAAYGGVDVGCSREAPICMNSKTKREVGARAAGDVCTACVKVYSRLHYRFGFADYGCGSQLPRCMTSENGDPVRSRAGAKCCTAKGVCQTESLCPCNRPESVWSKVVAGINPWDSDDLTCLSDTNSITSSLFVTGSPLGIGVSEVELSESDRWWVCSDQPRVSLTISEAEATVCYKEVQAATEVMGLSNCLTY
jgi:hypothetical protein